jgi:Histidine kinase-, DNA gyrase B-, and HSP90-like ATPase
MESRVLKRTPAREQIDLDDIRVGKDVIEIITSGMYVSPITIYREYIQNSADSIDQAKQTGVLTPREHGRVEIIFDQSARTVSVRDNGAGIKTGDAVSTLVAIGASPKRGSAARGFRGVGRLSGLAHCRELEFKTKAAGEKKVVSVTWDCRGLRERLSDSAFGGDLRRIIADAVSVSYETADDSDDHFFEVRLKDIARLRNDLLLNERVIAHYLSQVGPLSFSSDFSFGAQIEEGLSARLKKAPLNLVVAGERIYRPYRDEMIFPATAHKLRVENIEFLEFANVDGDTGAIVWIAHHEYVRSILPTLGVRGLRARVGDLQVGDAGLFDDIFKEPRFNGWSIGEIHVTDPRIVPNARRDNFEVNHHYYNLLVQLGPLAGKITQRCRFASMSRNSEQVVKNVITETSARLKQKRPFDRAELSRFKSAVLRARTKTKRVALAVLRTELESSLDKLRAKLTKVSPKRGASAVALDEVATLIAKHVTNPAQRAKLIESLRKLCE